MKNKYSIFSLIKNAFTYHENWQRAWRDPEPKREYEAIIIGGGENTKKLIQQIKDINILGYNILGYFYSKNDKSISKIYQYLGNFNNLEPFVKKNNINEVFIALDQKEDFLLDIISNLKNLNVCIKIVPDIYDVLTGQAKMHSVTGMPLIDINPNILTEFQFLLKRFLDLFISFLGLIILFPGLIFVALIILGLTLVIPDLIEPFPTAKKRII